MADKIASFAKRLSQALEIRNMKAVDLSKKTNVSEGTISCYINGKYEAKQNRVHVFAEALNVNPAWLMGYDVPMELRIAKEQCVTAKFASIIKNLRVERGITQEQLASMLKVSRSTVGMYETGNREPDIETLEAIADIFNVDMDYLMGRSGVQRKNPVAHAIPAGLDPMPDMTIGELIKLRRKEISMSAERLAEKVGVSPATIYRYENGDIEKVPVGVLKNIASALNTTPAHLMDMSIANNIKNLRLSENLSQAELGKIAGVTDKAVSTWEAGLKTPRMGAVEKLAKHFGVPKSAILDDNATPAIPAGFEPLPKMSTVPLVGAIACGTPILAEQNIEARIGIPAAWRADFALTCKGDSMEPKIKDGDIVAIRTQPEVENGEVAAVRIGEEATLKRVFLFPDHLELRAENPAFSSIILIGEDMNTVHIEGKAVGFCRGI